jgi:hypothetical protein
MKTRKQAGAAVPRGTQAGTTRRTWSAPRLRRLAASEAELGVTVTVDAEGHS